MDKEIKELFTAEAEWEKTSNFLFQKLRMKIFNEEFISFFCENMENIDCWRGETEKLLLNYMLGKSVDSANIATDIFTKNFSLVFDYFTLKYGKLILNDVSKVKIPTVNQIMSNNLNNITLCVQMEKLKRKYISTAYEYKDLKLIDNVFRDFPIAEHFENLAKKDSIIVNSNGRMEFKSMPYLWTILFLHTLFTREEKSSDMDIHNFVYPNIQKALANIDAVKDELRRDLPDNLLDRVDEIFCDEIKAYVLLKYHEDEYCLREEIIELLNKNYDEAFKKVNGISFSNYRKIKNKAIDVNYNNLNTAPAL